MLRTLISDLDGRGLTVLAARARGPLRDMVISAELDELIPPERQLASVREGVD